MKKVAIYAQNYNTTVEQEIIELITILKEYDVAIYFEKKIYDLISKENKLAKQIKTFSNFNDLKTDFKCLFTLGGDGTILRAITYVRDSNIPIIGINTGRLGFLATISRDKISESIKNFFNGCYKIRKRTLLEVCTTPENGKLKSINFALNEVTIARKQTTAMIGIKTHIDKEYLTNYWADGLIISTPTGSTGYSLSCNGPVIAPDCNSFIINPIAPHNLNARPILINDNTTIDLEVSSREDEFLISLDSRIIAVHKETKVRIKKADFTISTVLFEEESFLNTIRTKLLWGGDTRNEVNRIKSIKS